MVSLRGSRLATDRAPFAAALHASGPRARWRGRVGVGTDLCFYGAARTVGERAALSGPGSAARLCAVAPASRRDACFGGVGIAVGLRYPTNAARRRSCARLAGTSADACSEKAIAAVDATGRAAWG